MMLVKNLTVYLTMSILVMDTRAQSTDHGLNMSSALASEDDTRAALDKRREELEKEKGPDIVKGRNLDNITPQEQKMFFEISEDICNRYRTENVEFRKNCDPIYISPKVGGKVAKIEEFPHMVMLGRKKIKTDGYSWYCGGSLISDQHVLSAAQCLFSGLGDEDVSGPPRAVLLGVTYVDESGGVVVPISTIIPHPKYKAPRVYHDIAVVKMAKKVTFTDKIQPACLGVPPPVGETVIATGWGDTKMKNAPSRDLRAVILPIWDIEECEMAYRESVNRNFRGPDNESQVCAGDRRGGRDTCQGDAGGPIQIQDGCTWRVVGVISFGRSCGLPQYPGVYATASKDFIVSTVFGSQQPNLTRYSESMKTDKPTFHVEYNNGSISKATDNKQEVNVSADTKDNRQLSGSDSSIVNIQQTTRPDDGDLDSNANASSSGYGNLINKEQTNAENRRPSPNQQVTGASNVNSMNNRPATHVKDGNINNQATTISNNGNLINSQPTVGADRNILARINTKLREDLNVVNKLNINVPINSSLEIDTEINKNRLWTHIRINNTAIVHTVEIQIPE